MAYTSFPIRAVLSYLLSALCVAALHGADKKVLLIAGPPSHGPGAHEHNAGVLLLQKCLSGVKGLKADVRLGGWPKDDAAFTGVDAIIIYADGQDRHIALQNDNLARLDQVLSKGVGLGFAHYAVDVLPGTAGQAMQRWLGGFYENEFSVNPMWKPEFATFPQHPVTRGVQPFATDDEWYYHMRFREGMKGVTPILTAMPPKETITSRQ